MVFVFFEATEPVDSRVSGKALLDFASERSLEKNLGGLSLLDKKNHEAAFHLNVGLEKN